ncbi:hypothetical protein N9Y17_02205 [Gammaproteobacteria bacterium]|nr:hypothetical protein [Gammaproteobacteria bacterium]
MSADQMSTPYIESELGVHSSDSLLKGINVFSNQDDIHKTLLDSHPSEKHQLEEEVDGCRIIYFNPKQKEVNTTQPESIFDSAQSIAKNSDENKQEAKSSHKGYDFVRSCELNKGMPEYQAPTATKQPDHEVWNAPTPSC